LLAAYSYLHQKNNDQSLAWFAVASKSADRSSPEGIKARDATSRILSALSTARFDELSQRWSADAFAGPLFRKERLRRAQGGAIMYPDYNQMFSPKYYSGYDAGDTSYQPSMASAQQQSPEFNRDAVTIGVLLPLSGRFAEHAQKVKQGIELAVEESPYAARIQLKIADTGGSPSRAISEYERLVRDDQVDTVLGPLLVKTTEAVSSRSSELGVPILSFTKRSGIPQLGPTVFRLGATSESQVRELVSYSYDVLGLRRFAVVYPETPAGQEFASIFRDQIDEIGGEIVDSLSYFDRTPESLAGSIDRLVLTSPEAIFVPDTLERAFPVLEVIRGSELRDVVLLGPAQWSDPVAVRGYGQLIEGAVFVSLFNPLSQASPVIRFVEKYREKFSQEPELLAAQSFDATNLILKSVFNENTEQANRLLELGGAENGVTGLLEVEVDGEISRRMSVLRLTRGNLIEVMVGGNTSQSVPSDLLPSQPSSSLKVGSRARIQ
jgi:ABC-type branched-subunit amino acid transport system substrate-binding protein